jgi:predicted Zn-dependent protease
MRLKRYLAIALILSSALGLILAGCSSSPKSGAKKPKRTVLLTTYDDARVGEEASQEVEAEIGILDDEELNAYVNEIGRKLLRGIPNRSFVYHFAVVDQFEPNAFALPGGYIYISRGLLALANSEDELANVIGHEITHAARRHAASQQALARRMNPLSMPWTRAANIASYGRDMERQADRGGQMLAAAAGYDPMGMSTFLRSLGQLERLLIGHSRLPTFLDTHPGAQERAAENAARAHELRWKRDPSLGDTRSAHLRRVEGLALGDRPQAGIFQGSQFLHPDLDFQLRFPPGWRTSNTNRAVGAMSPEGDAVVYLSADLPLGDPRAAAEGFVAKSQEEMDVSVVRSQPVVIAGIDCWRMQLESSGGMMSLTATVTFIPYRDAVWRITGLTPSRAADKYQGRLLNTARSFRPLTDEERDAIEGTRLELVSAREGENLTALSERTGNAWDASRTAVLNGVFVNHRFESGALVKTARTERYTPSGP